MGRTIIDQKIEREKKHHRAVTKATKQKAKQDRRFQAAVAAMQGILANDVDEISQEQVIELAVEYADLLLAELDKTTGKNEKQPQEDGECDMSSGQSRKEQTHD